MNLRIGFAIFAKQKSCWNFDRDCIALVDQLESIAILTILNLWGFPGGAVVKNPPANAGDMGSSPGPGRSHMPRSN